MMKNLQTNNRFACYLHKEINILIFLERERRFTLRGHTVYIYKIRTRNSYFDEKKNIQ